MDLIKAVKLSKKTGFVGESIRVEVQASDPAADVTINGIYGAKQFLQFRSPGSHMVVIAATLGPTIQQIAEKVKILPAVSAHNLPIIWSTQDRYRPRKISFSIANAESDADISGYSWTFGDGTYGVSDGSGISHDYSNALVRDRLYTNFNVKVDAHFNDGFVAAGNRTISVFNTYGYNKSRRHVLTPRVEVQNPLTIPIAFFLVGEVFCRFTVTNLEDEEISFTEETHEWLNADASENPAITGNPEITLQSATPAPSNTASGTVAVIGQLGPAVVSTDLRVPAQSTILVERSFPKSTFIGSVFGVAIHLRGVGLCSKLPAISSAYIEAKLPMQWSGYVPDPILSRLLSYISWSNHTKNVITHEDLTNYFPRSILANNLEPPALSVPSTAILSTRDQPARIQRRVGLPSFVRTQNFSEMSSVQFTPLLRKLTSPILISIDDPAPILGQQCDPDNLPDGLPEGMVCQLTGQTEWRYVPGRVLNAKKGDVLLNPGGTSLVAQLMRQLTPAQFYSHSGIMTKNHVEVRHSTGSPEWLRDHPAGSFLGAKGTDGFLFSALKYLWPGTVTQTIDNSYYGEWMTSPDTGPYNIAGFSFDPNLSDTSTILYPLVVKPNPFDETLGVRLTLHSIADAALAINGHSVYHRHSAG